MAPSLPPHVPLVSIGQIMEGCFFRRIETHPSNALGIPKHRRTSNEVNVWMGTKYDEHIEIDNYGSYEVDLEGEWMWLLGASTQTGASGGDRLRFVMKVVKGLDDDARGEPDFEPCAGAEVSELCAGDESVLLLDGWISSESRCGEGTVKEFYVVESSKKKHFVREGTFVIEACSEEVVIQTQEFLSRRNDLVCEMWDFQKEACRLFLQAGHPPTRWGHNH